MQNFISRNVNDDILYFLHNSAFVNSEFMEPVFDEDEDLPTLLFYDEQALKDSDKRRDI